MIGDELHLLARVFRASAGGYELPAGGAPANEPALEMLTPPEVAKLLGLNKSTVYRLIQTGAMPSVKIGRSVRVRRADLAAWSGHTNGDEIEVIQPVTRFGRPREITKKRSNRG